MKVKLRKTNIERRKLRVKKKIFGTPDRPRISVFKSNKYTYAQLIDDVNGKTLVASKGASGVESGLHIGEDLAKRAKAKKIKKAVFDRNGYKYHGIVKNVAEGSRKGGLEL